MGRSPCCDKIGLKKGPWTPEEDQKLLAYVQEHGHGSWRALPSRAGLERCGKSCRLRWTNYLRPDIKRGQFSLQEEQTIIQLHALLGNRWSAIATHLPKRTDNEIKNYWNTHLKKRLAKMGIDPVTHKPKNDPLLSTNDGGRSKSAAKLSHLAQWESARLEAEARLVRESKLRTTLHRSSPASNFTDGLLATKTLAHSTAESPSSTLTTFSGEIRENNLKQQAIEFVGTSSSSNLGQHGMVKEEGEHDDNWKNSSNPSLGEFKAAMQLLDGHTNNNNNSLLARVSSTEENIEAEGFTDLLLNNCGGGGGQSLSDNSENNGCGGNGDDLYYEDSKDYWSSILSLVDDSSPSESPMF